MKLKIGDSINITFNNVNIVGYVSGISTRENDKEFVTYYYFDQISDSGDEEISFSLSTRKDKTTNENRE